MGSQPASSELDIGYYQANRPTYFEVCVRHAIRSSKSRHWEHMEILMMLEVYTKIGMWQYSHSTRLRVFPPPDDTGRLEIVVAVMSFRGSYQAWPSFLSTQQGEDDLSSLYGILIRIPLSIHTPRGCLLHTATSRADFGISYRQKTP